MPWATSTLNSCILLLAYFVTVSNATTSPFVKVLSDDLKVNAFVTSECDSYKSLHLEDDTLFIGGREALYRQEPVNISKPVREKILWEASQERKHLCLALPQGEAEICNNFIRIIQPYNATHLILCGTMAFAPKNIFLEKKTGNLLNASNFTSPLCSFHPSDNVTSVMGEEGGVYSSIAATSRPQPQTQIGIVKNLPRSSFLLTSHGFGKMINGNPTFAHSFSAPDIKKSTKRPRGSSTNAAMKKLYFVFGESVSEQYNRYNYGTRIAQVCANDKGDWDKGWTSFLKVPLLCQTDENDPFIFNSVTHSTMSDDGVLYGTFNSQSSLFRSGAVCAFRLKDIQKAFHVRKFWSLNSNGEYRVKENQIPSNPSPGDCATSGNSSSGSFSSQFIYFMKSHHLVATDIKPIQPVLTDSKSGGPLLTRDRDAFTKIQVESVEDLSGITHRVLYIGTESGNVIKFVSILKNNRVDNLQLAEYELGDEKITDLLLSSSHKQLYVQTASKVLQIPTGNCDVYTKTCSFCDPCRMCIASRDPMCGWNESEEKCVDVRDSNRNMLRQNVTSGDVTSCDDVKVDDVVMKTPQYGFPVILGHPVINPSMSVQWINYTECEEILPETSKSDHYRITTDKRLEITSFSRYDAESLFIAIYKIGETAVLKKMTSFKKNPPSMTPTTPANPIPTTTKTISETLFTPRKLSTVLTPSVTQMTSTLSGSESQLNDPSAAGPSLIIVIVSAFLVLGLITLAFIFFRRRSRKALKRESEFKVNIKDSNVYYAPQSDVAVDGIEKDEKVYPGKYESVPIQQKEEEEYPLADECKYIDDETDSSGRRPDKIVKRAKSVSAKDFKIRIGDDEVRYSTIKRHKKDGTLLIEIKPSPDYEYELEDSEVPEVSNIASEYEKLFGSPSFKNESRVEAISPHPQYPVGDESFELDLSDVTKPLMQDAHLSRFFGDSKQSIERTSPRTYLPEDNIPHKFSSSTYNMKARSNRSSPLITPREPKTNDTLQLPHNSDSKTPTSTESSGSAQFQTPPSTPK